MPRKHPFIETDKEKFLSRINVAVRGYHQPMAWICEESGIDPGDLTRFLQGDTEWGYSKVLNLLYWVKADLTINMREVITSKVS